MLYQRKEAALTNAARMPEDEGVSARRGLSTENAPVLLTLPPRPIEDQLTAEEESVERCLQQLQVIETGCGPKVETALLADLLARHLGLGQALTDPVEVHNSPNPLAAANAYKHRLHALRCEYVSACLRIQDLETEMERKKMLEKHIQFLEATLAEMLASRGWKLVEKISRWRRRVSAWLAG